MTESKLLILNLAYDHPISNLESSHNCHMASKDHPMFDLELSDPSQDLFVWLKIILHLFQSHDWFQNHSNF